MMVLIHLNIDVDTDDPDEAARLAADYLYRHNVPLDDIALVEALG